MEEINGNSLPLKACNFGGVVMPERLGAFTTRLLVKMAGG